jgi:hypothetical protein
MALFHIGPGMVIHRYLFLKLTAEWGVGEVGANETTAKTSGPFPFILFMPYTVRNTKKISKVDEI